MIIIPHLKHGFGNERLFLPSFCVPFRAPVSASARRNMTHLLRKLNTLQNINTKQMAIERKKHKKYMLLDIIDRVLSIFTSLVVFSGAQSKQMTSEDI